MNIILFDRDEDFSVLSFEDFRAKHILNILKLKQGDVFRCGIINQSEGEGTLIDVTDSFLRILYKPVRAPEHSPVSLAVAQVRPICMQRILRDAASLGCENLFLTGSDTGEKSYLNSTLYKTDLYRKFLIDGAMQSGSAFVPNVFFSNSVRELLHKTELLRLSVYTHKILMDNKTESIGLSELKDVGGSILAIGPERGWSDKERKLFNDSGFQTCSMGKRILRTETACISAVTVILSKMNYM